MERNELSGPRPTCEQPTVKLSDDEIERLSLGASFTPASGRDAIAPGAFSDEDFDALWAGETVSVAGVAYRRA